MSSNRFESRLKRWLQKLLPDSVHYQTQEHNVTKGPSSKLYYPVRLVNVSLGAYSYIGMYSHMKNVEIGKFCSIGPECFFGWGIHPINGVSTSPMFYSTGKQNGMTLSATDKIEETKKIVIGNDVFIGMRATILDGVTIGNGAVIGAGAVVSKDIPPYAVAVGNPIKILKYRFSEEKIKDLQEMKWWDWSERDLAKVERHFFDVDDFILRAKEETK